MATVVLWTITAYLIYESKAYWVTLIPALFMTMVCSTYILVAPEGFGLENDIAYIGGGITTIGVLVLFWIYATQRKKVLASI